MRRKERFLDSSVDNEDEDDGNAFAWEISNIQERKREKERWTDRRPVVRVDTMNDEQSPSLPVVQQGNVSMCTSEEKEMVDVVAN